MDNYFNYFTEIEEYFWKKRGTSLLLSTLDWALIDSWKEAQIPLEAVLKGIDRAFEKFDSRRRKIQMVNSLAYCQQEVLAAVEEQERARPQHPGANEPFPREELCRFFRTNAETVEKAAQKLDQESKPESAGQFRQIAGSLRDLESTAASGGALDLEDVERRLTVLEEKIFSILLTLAGEQDLVAIRAEMDRALAPVRGKMDAPQITQLQKQFQQRKLLEKASLPRLSLFYL
jgi:hypothetical protein